jgi:phosphopantothenoylcysteine decarboxylase/phosphopantothenate--cysteine ligase
LIGFAAESNDIIENARRKLEKKRLDVVIANDISRRDIGLGSDYNQATIITAAGAVFDTPRLLKNQLAELILDRYVEKKHAKKR